MISSMCRHVQTVYTVVPNAYGVSVQYSKAACHCDCSCKSNSCRFVWYDLVMLWSVWVREVGTFSLTPLQSERCGSLFEVCCMAGLPPPANRRANRGTLRQMWIKRLNKFEVAQESHILDFHLCRRWPGHVGPKMWLSGAFQATVICRLVPSNYKILQWKQFLDHFFSRRRTFRLFFFGEFLSRLGFWWKSKRICVGEVAVTLFKAPWKTERKHVGPPKWNG